MGQYSTLIDIIKQVQPGDKLREDVRKVLADYELTNVQDVPILVEMINLGIFNNDDDRSSYKNMNDTTKKSSFTPKLVKAVTSEEGYDMGKTVEILNAMSEDRIESLSDDIDEESGEFTATGKVRLAVFEYSRLIMDRLNDRPSRGRGLHSITRFDPLGYKTRRDDVERLLRDISSDVKQPESSSRHAILLKGLKDIKDQGASARVTLSELKALRDKFKKNSSQGPFSDP